MLWETFIKLGVWGWILFVVLSALIVTVPPQDLLPFLTAVRLAGEGEYSAIYPSDTLSSLFDVDARFVAVARAIAGEGYRGELVTAYVSPPPAILVAGMLPDSPVAAVLMVKTGIAAMFLACVAALERDVRKESPGAISYWYWTVLAVSPVFAYGLLLGQTSILLMVIATIAALEPGGIRNILGGVALGVASVMKVFPAAMIFAALFTGRRLMAGVALIVALCFTVMALLWLPWSLWERFVTTSARLGSRVIAEWNNASLDAGLAALATGRVGSALADPPLWCRMTGMAFRVILVGTILWMVVTRAHLSAARRWSLAWIALFAITPLLWIHYLICLVPVLQTEIKRGHGVFVVIAAMALSAGFAARVAGLPVSVVSALSVLGWMVTALGLVMLISKRE